jgi:hypothetical protein
METLNFEAVKMAIRQDKSGYVLTLAVHPDEVPVEMMRDWIGARYQVVMVRLNDIDQAMNRSQDLPQNLARQAGILCKDQMFQKFLLESGEIFDTNEDDATDWLRDAVSIKSRAELQTNQQAVRQFLLINQEFLTWKHQQS